MLAAGAAGTAISALAPSLPVMIVGQVLQGVATGLFPLAFSTIRHTLPAERSAGAIGLQSGVLGIGAGAGLVLSGIIVDGLGYRFIFWLPLVVILLSLVAVVRWVPDVTGPAKERINWPSAALMAGGLGATLFAVTRTAAWGWTAPATLGGGLAGIFLIGLWVVRDRRSDHPLVDMRTMRRRVVWTTDLAGLTLAAALYGAFILVPQYAQTPPERGFGFGASVTESGLLLLPLAVAMLVVGPLAGVVQRRFGGRLAIVAGASFATVAAVILVLFHDTVGWILVATGSLGVGIGLGYAAMSTLIAYAVPPDETGEATGVNTLSRQVGGAVGSSLAATIVAGSLRADGNPAEAGYVSGFAVAAGLGACAVVAALAIPRTSGQAARETPS